MPALTDLIRRASPLALFALAGCGGAEQGPVDNRTPAQIRSEGPASEAKPLDLIEADNGTNATH